MKKHFVKITSSLLLISFLFNQVMVTITYADDSVITSNNKAVTSTNTSPDYIPLSAWEESTSLISEVCSKLDISDISLVTYDDIKTIKSLSLTVSSQSLPQIIGDFTGLRVLELIGCNLNSIPDTICKLTNLEELNLSSNNISSLPESFSNLSNLIFLNLSSNSFDNLPEVLCDLPKLQYLDLSLNNISTVTNSISKFKSLVSLELANNSLTSLPNTISELYSLRYLGLSANNFYTIPEGIFSLTKLEDLKISQNNLIEIPNLIKEMSGDIINLTIDASQNQIYKLPETTTQNIISNFNLVPSSSNGIPTGSQLILTTNTLNLDNNEEISGDELNDLVNVNTVFSNNFSTSTPLDNRLSLEFIIDNKIVTSKELASYKSGIYKAYLKIKDADITNKNSISSTALTINIGNSSNDNNEDDTNSLVIPDDATGVIPYEYWENCTPLMIFTCMYLGASNINEVTFEDLANIEYVYLCNQNISSLPVIITKFSNLKELILANDKFTSIPKEVFKLSSLQSLTMTENKISKIPDDISLLANLNTLDISTNDITYISPNIKNLKNLTTLSLSNNKNIQSQLESIYTINSLKSLTLNSCNLYTLGDNINNLTNLESLEVWDNQLLSTPNTETINSGLNFITLNESEYKTLSLIGTDLTLTKNDILSQDTLHSLVNVQYSNSDGTITTENLNSNHQIDFIVNNKIITTDELSKYPNGSYTAYLIIDGADINSSNTKTSSAVTINITGNNEENSTSGSITTTPITTTTTTTLSSTTENTITSSNKLPSTGNESALFFLLSGSLSIGCGCFLSKNKSKKNK